MSEARAKIPAWAWMGLALGGVILVLILPGWVGTLRATHGAVASYVDLIGAANLGDMDGVRRRCSTSYLRSHAIEAAREGGVVGMPRNMHKNFQAWRQGEDVLLCPTNRVGPVYRFVREADVWKFDGLAGMLVPGGKMIGGKGGGAEQERLP